jgi:multidrug efflux pump subunit AcrB
MLRLALDKPTIVAAGMLILCIFGLSAVFRVPIQMIPDLDPRIVNVTTIWPGATPRDIEQEILVEQEEFLRGINGLVRMDSKASFGQASVELEFPFGMDINDALIRVNNALSQMSNYPENVDQPRISTSSASESSFAYFRIIAVPGSAEKRPIADELDWVEDNVKRLLERVPGVASVAVYGAPRRQVNIYLDPARLAARGLTLMQVRQALRARNRDVSGGDLDFGKRRYMIRTIGRFESIEDLNTLILTEREGAFIRLQDVGYAELGKTEQRFLSYSGGEPALSMRINKQSGSNVVAVLDGVMATIEELNKGVARERGLHIQLSSEDVRYIKNSVRTVLTNLLIGATLATLVLLLFLRSIPATLIGALGIPVCTLAAFLGLSLTGRTINVISLAGVAFAIGMTLDNSIVALENISRHIAQGKQRYAATLDGISEVWPAILASTLTTVLVFLPIALLEDEAGQLYGDIAIAISASIVMSMLVAIGLVPAACHRFLTEAPRDQTYGGSGNKLLELTQMLAARLLALSQRLQSNRRNQAVTLGVTLLLTVAVFRFLTPATSYLPEGEESKIFAFMFAPAGYNLATMQQIFEETDPPISAQINATTEAFEQGKTDFPPIVSHVSFVNPDRIMYVTEPTDPDHTEALKRSLDEHFDSVPGMQGFTSRGSIFSDNRGGTRSINVEISGRNLDQLFAVALQMLNRADDLFEGAQIRSDPPAPTLNMSQPMAYVRPDWDRAAELQVSQSELGYTLWAYSDGAFADEFFLDDDKLDIYLFSTEGTVNQPADLEQVMLHTASGSLVPLAALARVEERVGAASIPRVNGLRTVTLRIIPPPAMALETGAATVRRDLLDAMRDSGEIPDGISTQVTGATSKLEQTRTALAGNFALAILIAYLLMVAVFSHWGYPLLIMTTVPIGIGGGIVGLWLLNQVGALLPLLNREPLNQPLDVITMLGFLILIGTVVNNPILLVDRTIANIKQRQMNAALAIEEATRVRLRPVLMSTITTICGLSPLVFLPGAGAELYRGIGAIVLSGLLLSSLVTLLILPTLLRTVLDFSSPEVGTAASDLPDHS